MKKRFSTRGQGFIEYILLIVLIVVASLLALGATGNSIKSVFCNILAGDLGSKPGVCSSSYLNDDFKTLDHWDIVKGKWWLDNDRLCAGPGEGQILSTIPASDYVINLNGVNLEKGKGYSILFRISGSKKVDGYAFQYDPTYSNGAFLFRKIAHGREFSPFAIKMVSDFDWYQESHDIQVVVQGMTFTANIDGEMILQGSDTTFAEGNIGLQTRSSSMVCFDSIHVDPTP